jgi:hypothetical protein
MPVGFCEIKGSAASSPFSKRRVVAMAARKREAARPKLVVENPDLPAEQPREATDADTGATSDTDDIEELWEDDGLGDPLSTTHIHQVSTDKPKDFFRASPDRRYRKKTWVYAHKSENVVGVQYFIVAEAMRDKIPQARPCTLLTVVDRAGAPRIWPLFSPRPGENDNNAWFTARSVAREAFTNWIRLVWVGGKYESIVADPGYAPEPDFGRLPAFNKLIQTAFGPEGIIRNEENRAYRSMFGKAAQAPDDLAGDGEDDDEDDGNAEDAVS